jgi:serine/threonine-protein kinase RsbW
VSKEIKLNLPSKIESVEKAAHEAEIFAKRADFSDEMLFAVDMAIRESVANAVKHGNKLDETKPVEITFSDVEGNFAVSVRDFGEGFSLEEIPDPTNPENLLKASGRGILFMRSFMDEVEWTNHADGGTIVRMLKKREESKK